MAEMIRIHNCKTGQYIDRERTPEEQAEIDAQRAANAAMPVRKTRIQEFEERLAVLESKQ